MTLRSRLLRLLEGLLPLPTAPFHEEFVSDFICGELKRLGLRPVRDRYGNVIVKCGSGKAEEAWLAHMDHPGFEITWARETMAEAAWFGGVHPRYFVGSRVVIYHRTSGDIRARGVVRKTHQNSQGRVERMVLRVEGKVAEGDFGSWDLVPFRRRGERIHTKAADDLVGCATILAALGELQRRGNRRGVLGVFTRAEEQGFIGTLALVNSRQLSLRTRIVSIETSKAIPGVSQGGGPVIRLGDRAGVFHHEMVMFMDYVAGAMKEKDRSFTYQRRVMDGGTCEATPFLWSGYRSGGIAIPLGNYHNQGKEAVRPESVHLKDAEGVVRLLLGMHARAARFQTATGQMQRRWMRAWRAYGRRLRLPMSEGLK